MELISAARRSEPIGSASEVLKTGHGKLLTRNPALRWAICGGATRGSLAEFGGIVRLDFVGVDPGNPTDECPAVFVDRDTGDFYMQGETVTDPQVLAWINSDSRVLDTESVVRLPARMAEIILEAAGGTYERGKRRFAPGEHPRPEQDLRSRREGTDVR